MPPSLRRLSIEQFPSTPDELKPTFEQIFGVLNTFLGDTTSALDGGLTFSNFAATLKQVIVKVPNETWSAFTYSNSWVNDSSTNTAGYRISPSGWVTFRGAVKSGSGIPTAIATLPTGYWPEYEVCFPVESNGAYGKCTISAAGVVTASVGSTTKFDLTGIGFQAVSCAAPLAFTGPGWPISLQPDHGLPTRHVFLVQAQDTVNSTNFSVGAGAFDWSLTGPGTVLIKRMEGLSPGRTYKLTFLLLGG